MLELDGNQRRHLINVKQIFATWRQARRDLRRAGGMHWKAGPSRRRYLYRTTGRSEKAVGVRSAKTQRIYADHQASITALKARIAKSGAALEQSRRLSRALNLGRMPTIAARILRKLDDAALLDGPLLVAGTNALFAYESRTGVLFEDTIIATEDLDLLWDARRRMSLLLTDVRETGVLGLLQQVDKSFHRTKPFQAENDDPYLVDLIRPSEPNLIKSAPRLSKAPDDFDPAAIEGLLWLINAPKYEETLIAEDGVPARIVTVDPRAYALHKLWLSRRVDRSGLKQSRDLLQARAVADVAINVLGLASRTKRSPPYRLT